MRSSSVGAIKQHFFFPFSLSPLQYILRINQKWFVFNCWNTTVHFVGILQPHERDALLSDPLADTVHVTNEQEKNNWSSDPPKAPDAHAHRKPNSRSKHPSGSNVSFSKDTEGGEEEHTQVGYIEWAHNYSFVDLQDRWPCRVFYLGNLRVPWGIWEFTGLKL